jgi:hypothetical protein
MQEQIQSFEEPVQPTIAISETPPRSNPMKVAVIVGIGILLILGSVLAGIQIGKGQQTNPTPIAGEQMDEPATSITELSPSPRTTTAVATVEKDWLTYTHQKFPDLADWQIPWKGFVLYYPASWTLSENRDVAAPSLNLKITKTNGDYLEIIQGAGGGGYCLFPDQPEYASFEGMATKYSKYVEIDKGSGIVWRLADWPTSGDMWSHQLCESFTSELFKNGFTDTTTIGFTKIKVTDPASLLELKEILSRVEIQKSGE